MSDELKKNINLIKQDFSNLENTFAVKKIGIFGSYVRGDQTSKSDIDLLVEFSVTPTLFKLVELEDYLSELLNKKVDLVLKDGLKKAIKSDVLKDTIYV